MARSSRSCIHALFTFSRATLAVGLVGKPTWACSLTDPPIPSSPRVACHVLGSLLGLFMENVVAHAGFVGVDRHFGLCTMWARSSNRGSLGDNSYSPFSTSNGTTNAWDTPLHRGREGRPHVVFTQEDNDANMVALFGKIHKEDVRACDFNGAKDGAAVWNTLVISTLHGNLSPWMMQVVIGTRSLEMLETGARDGEHEAAELVKACELQAAYAGWLLKRLNRDRPEALALAKYIAGDVNMLQHGTMVMQWILSRGKAVSTGEVKQAFATIARFKFQPGCAPEESEKVGLAIGEHLANIAPHMRGSPQKEQELLIEAIPDQFEHVRSMIRFNMEQEFQMRGAYPDPITLTKMIHANLYHAAGSMPPQVQPATPSEEAAV